MSDFFDEFLRQQARWLELVESPFERLAQAQRKLMEQIEAPFERLAREQRKLEKLLDPIRLTDALRIPALESVSEANRLVLGMSASNLIERSLRTEVNREWQSAQSSGDLSSVLAGHISHVGQLSASAEIRLFQVDWGRLGGAWNLQSAERDALSITTSEMTRSYRGLLAHVSERLVELPRAISANPPEELGRAADLLVIASQGDDALSVVAEVTATVVSATRALVDESLTALDVGLMRMLQGARMAVESRNPDRVRHVSVSLRELATKVLHRLAPDEEVQAWSSKPHHLHAGRPTRRGRLEYIAREVEAEPLSEFMDADYKAAVKFFEVLHGGTHRELIEFTDQQLSMLIARAEALIYFLLAIRTQ